MTIHGWSSATWGCHDHLDFLGDRDCPIFDAKVSSPYLAFRDQRR
jgi:hypothetical protein